MSLARWHAEEVVTGTPLSGPDELVERVQDAIDEARDEGIGEGHTESRDEGITEALDSLVEALIDLDIEAKFNSTDSLESSVDKIIEAVQRSHVEQFNQGVDALAAELDTKRAAKVAETVWKKEEG